MRPVQKKPLLPTAASATFSWLRKYTNLSLSFQVAELVTSEFFEQGDRERLELKLTPSVSKIKPAQLFAASPPPLCPRRADDAKNQRYIFLRSCERDCKGNVRARASSREKYVQSARPLCCFTVLKYTYISC